MYWQNPITGEPEAFVARENVTSGRKLRGTYCPEHLHLYHLLVKWEKEQEKANARGHRAAAAQRKDRHCDARATPRVARAEGAVVEENEQRRLLVSGCV